MVWTHRRTNNARMPEHIVTLSMEQEKDHGEHGLTRFKRILT